MKHLIAIILLLAAMPVWAQNSVDIDSVSNGENLQNRINDADSAASVAAAPAAATATPASNNGGDSGPNLLVMGILGLCGLVGFVMSAVALSKIKGIKREKDNEITALKTALQKRNEEVEKHFRQLEDRLAADSAAHHDRAAAASPRPAATAHHAPSAPATPKKVAAPITLYLSRPDANGVFMTASARIEPGNSLFKLTTSDGQKGTFEVINDASVHQLALMMPTENLTRACTGPNIQISAGKTAIVTDAPGAAVKEGAQWRIVRQAVVHYK